MIKQGIIIQGPTEFYKKVCEVYCQVDNVIWSTWDDEPVENINFITQKGIHVILNRKPEYNGYLNINLQSLSTLKGVEYFKEKGFTEVIKVRGDILFYNIDKVLPHLHKKEIAFLGLNNPLYKPELAYYLDYYHHGFDFTTDHVVFGEINNMYNAFNYYIDIHNPVPPEAIILRNYLFSKGDTNFDYNNLINKGVYFFAKDCLENGSDIIWLKDNWNFLGFILNPHQNFIF
jgi:hypothetical protein